MEIPKRAVWESERKHHLENYKLQKEQNHLVATSDRCRSAPRNEPFINPVAVLFSEAELENEKIGKAVSRKSSSRNTVYRLDSDFSSFSKILAI